MSADKYFSKHVAYNAAVHFLIGMGAGMLLIHTVLEGHTMRYGIVLIAIGLIGHLYPATLGKKNR